MASAKTACPDHAELFRSERYQEIFDRKKAYENAHSPEEVERVLEYTKSLEYQEKNFAREAAAINPLKSCQPLGALYAGIGFADTLPYVHGSQGCASYFRSHFSRHFKEPFPAVSDSMTEDAAVFGGHANMYQGLENAHKLYKPKMIALCTSCMAEVIGDDLSSFTKNAKDQGNIPADFPVACAHTPSFVGSHITGYDAMMVSILETMGEKSDKTHDAINVILGFDTYLGNFHEIRRIFGLFGVEVTILSDPTAMLDSPTDGEYQMYRGGTSLEELKDAPNAKGTIILQKYALPKTAQLIKNKWEQEVKVVNPIGIAGTDELIMAIAELTGKEVPDAITRERGQLIDAIADSYYWIYGKSFAINADPDQAYGITRFILELGGEPRHVLVTNAVKKWEKETQALLAEFPHGEGCQVYPKKDMWHMRSLLFTDPVDFIIGSSHAKYLWRDTRTPLIRFGFPLFDRHHLHRTSTIGYQGGINLLTTIVNTILDEADRASLDSPSFDLVR
ncbi:nitrogenase molybdenum-iron protein subunit beta [Desulfurispira natronophila]|uniref:Nitrogenase molybdenum-iron protein beta chain n=1 Tax=Desulfurispira natronophila TaxID=682562 RepID=A0A7W7Y581_9BACT|nr:nitrogenase molybdenum-iron protein subunit beta [Desulfurispira natronophila]MBB5022331.1 nitrogenase molybdenum-iron protein beta chain [Desulfurispira natronophila]